MRSDWPLWNARRLYESERVSQRAGSKESGVSHRASPSSSASSRFLRPCRPISEPAGSVYFRTRKAARVERTARRASAAATRFVIRTQRPLEKLISAALQIVSAPRAPILYCYDVSSKIFLRAAVGIPPASPEWPCDPGARRKTTQAGRRRGRRRKKILQSRS